MKIAVHYFEASEDEEVLCGKDNFPLISQVDINNVNVEVPEYPVTDLPETPGPTPQRPETLPIELVAVAILIVTTALVGVGLLVYVRKRKREERQA